MLIQVFSQGVRPFPLGNLWVGGSGAGPRVGSQGSRGSGTKRLPRPEPPSRPGPRPGAAERRPAELLASFYLCDGPNDVAGLGPRESRRVDLVDAFKFHPRGRGGRSQVVSHRRGPDPGV